MSVSKSCPIYREFSETDDKPSVDLKAEVLCKYRDVESGIKLLQTKMIYFSDPGSFNDPFDCIIPIRFDLLTDSQFEDYAMYIDRRNLGRGNKEWIDALKMNEPGWGNLEYRRRHSQRQVEAIRRDHRVFCLSLKNDHSLMWAHYSSSHKGICVGFNVNHLFYNTGGDFGKVVYHDKHPEFVPEMDKLDSWLTWKIAQVISKPRVWNYEDEYRLFKRKPSENLQVISPKAISEIIFGCRITEKDKELIFSEVLKNPEFNHIRFFQALKTDYSYDLSVAEIKISGQG